MDDIYKALSLESPFRWSPTKRRENEGDFDMEQEDKFSFINFCAQIVSVYDEYIKKNLSGAQEISNAVEDKLNNLKHGKDTFFLRSEDALFHVLYSCQAILALHSGADDKEISSIMKKIKLIDEMNAPNKATVQAIKACAHALFSFEGIDSSITFINNALSSDSDWPFWSFLKAAFLQKRRQYLDEVPSLDERELMEVAVKKEPNNPLFMVHFADSLKDRCKNAYKRQKSHFWFVARSAEVNYEQEIDKKYAAASEFYKKSYALKPQCPVIAFKCANGLMRLPQKHQDVELIKEIVLQVAPKFPKSGFGNLVVALYHEKFSKKIDLTRHHLARCVELNVFDGWMNSLRLEFIEKKENSNPLKTLEKMLENFKEPIKQEIIISQIISFYVFVESNLKKACEYMLKYYKRGNRGNSLEIHKSCFQGTNGPVSLVDIVTDQVKLKMREGKMSPEHTQFFNGFVQQMNFHNVEVLKGDPTDLLGQIKKSSDQKTETGTKNCDFSAKHGQPKSFQSEKNVHQKFDSRNSDSTRGFPKDGKFSRQPPCPYSESQENPSRTCSDRVLKSQEKSIETSRLNESARRTSEKQKAEDLKELMDLCQSTSQREDQFKRILEKLKDFSLRDFDDNRSEGGNPRVSANDTRERRTKRGHSRESYRERDSREKKDKNRSSLDCEDEMPRRKTGNRRTSLRSSSSSTDRSSRRKRCKHKKKRNSSESSDNFDDRRRRRSRSTSRRNKKSHRGKSRKSHRKRDSSTSSTVTDQSADRRHSRHRRRSSGQRSDKHYNHRAVTKESSRKGKKSSKKRSNETGGERSVRSPT